MISDDDIARIMPLSYIQRLVIHLYKNALRIKCVFSYNAKNKFYFNLFIADYMAGHPTCMPYIKTDKPWLW